MKKFLAAALSMAIIMSLTACVSTKKPEQTTAAVSETTAETSATVSTEPSATTTANSTEPYSEYVKHEIKKVKVTSLSDHEEEGMVEDELEYHIPQLLIKSSYADEVNKEISSAVEKYGKDMQKEEADHYTGSAYAVFVSKDILSLVFMTYEETDLNVYKVYNIDVKTGEKVDNARIAEIAGVKSIRQAGKDALQNWYNKQDFVKVKNYKVVLEKGQKMDGQLKEVERTFSEKYLNDKTQIGLTNEGKLFFISTGETMGAADLYEWVYDSDGNDIDNEDSPFWVGFRNPEDGGEGDED